MIYPTISEYIEAICSAEDNFNELTHLRAVRDGDGTPVMSSGNFAVVFKMKDVESDKFYALKCFTKEQEGRGEAYQLIAEELKDVDSPYLTSIRYLDKELFVDTGQTDETEFPVLLMDWVEGIPLDKYLRENLDDKYALEMLAYRFSQLAQWLIPQPFAHGDLKPDNILVREDGTLVLVDYDGMYVPAMRGQKARELGSPDFRHPSRKENDFDEHIDDFPLVSILLSLKAISLNPQLITSHGASDRLLFSEQDYHDISQCQSLKVLFPSEDMELNRLVGLFTIALSEKHLANLSLSLLQLCKPSSKKPIPVFTVVTGRNKDIGLYSKDGIRLIKGVAIQSYTIRPGTKIIGKKAFYECWGLEQVNMPHSITLIEDEAFNDCWSLKQINLPSSITHIGDWAFCGCNNLAQVTIPNSINHIGCFAFHCCTRLTQLKIPNSITRIEDGAFLSCINLAKIQIPNSVTYIGNSAFGSCHSLKEVRIPYSVTDIGANPFADCSHLEHIYYESNRFIIINEQEIYNHDLTLLIACLPKANLYCFPASITHVGDYAFSGCSDLTQIQIPNSVTHIGDYAFCGCKSLLQIRIPDSVLKIGNFAFKECDILTRIQIPNSVKYIGENVFSWCRKLTEIQIPMGTRAKFAAMLPSRL